jgi:hypothetical protein
MNKALVPLLKSKQSNTMAVPLLFCPQLFELMYVCSCACAQACMHAHVGNCKPNTAYRMNLPDFKEAWCVCAWMWTTPASVRYQNLMTVTIKLSSKV